MLTLLERELIAHLKNILAVKELESPRILPETRAVLAPAVLLLAQAEQFKLSNERTNKGVSRG